MIPRSARFTNPKGGGPLCRAAPIFCPKVYDVSTSILGCLWVHPRIVSKARPVEKALKNMKKKNAIYAISVVDYVIFYLY